jgi:hypothetical protein
MAIPRKTGARAGPLLEKVREKRLSEIDKTRLDQKITKQDCELAIRSMADDKSPGPDKLPADIYKQYEALILDNSTTCRQKLASMISSRKIPLKAQSRFFTNTKGTQETCATTDQSHSYRLTTKYTPTFGSSAQKKNHKCYISRTTRLRSRESNHRSNAPAEANPGLPRRD